MLVKIILIFICFYLIKYGFVNPYFFYILVYRDSCHPNKNETKIPVIPPTVFT